jgi:hypothetical protein
MVIFGKREGWKYELHTGKYKSVLLGMIKPFAWMPVRQACRSPLCLIWDTSPFCQVWRRVIKSFASQFWRNRSSQRSRRKEARSGYLDNKSAFWTGWWKKNQNLNRHLQTIPFVFVFSEPLYFVISRTCSWHREVWSAPSDHMPMHYIHVRKPVYHAGGILDSDRCQNPSTPPAPP